MSLRLSICEAPFRPRCALFAVGVVVLLAGAPRLAAESLGAISGVVLSAVSGAPLSASTVTLSQADGSPLRTIITDRQGKFAFEQLPPGYYLLKASHQHFATGRYGQKSWNQAGQPIGLGAGAGVSAEILLHRLGVITGSVVDDNGEGIPDFAVNAVTADPNTVSGRISWSGVTDDRGVFRIPGLDPGRYYVATAPRESSDGAGLLPTYYPKTLNMSEGRVVTVDVDRETEGVHIQPISGRLLRLSGMLNGAARYASSEVSVSLFRDEEKRESQAGAFGQFSFAGLVPGHYTLVAQLSSPQGKLAAYQPVDVYEDHESVVVSLAPAPEVRVRLIDDKGAAVSDTQVLVFLSRVENGARTQPVRLEPAQGSYVAEGLMPGQWRFFVVCPESQAVDEISVDGKDGLGGFALMPGQKAAAAIRLQRDAGKVHGTVADAAGQPARGASVVCYPLDPQNRFRLGGFRSQKANMLGQYRFGGLPEGDYLIFASEMESFKADDQLEKLQGQIPSLHVGRAADLAQDLRAP